MITLNCELSTRHEGGESPQTASVEISSSETVADLKLCLCKKFGVSNEKDFSLVCGSKTIDDLDQRLSDTEISVDQGVKITLMHLKSGEATAATAINDEKPKEMEVLAPEEVAADETEQEQENKCWFWNRKSSGKLGNAKDVDSSAENSPNNSRFIGPLAKPDQCSTSPTQGNKGKGKSNFLTSSNNSGGFFNSGWLRGGGSSYISDEAHPSRSGVPGLVGLGNLGNTCYMNSSLQCLLHTRPLMDLFLSGHFMADLNRNNPLGQKGELAEAFGKLMTNVWKEGVSHVSPRGFKSKIGSFSSTFSGYGQQDSQELLAFLMDGLHEDLNRVQKKPYVKERDDADKLPDDELARVTWEGHLQRNDSFIVDRCLGMYRSTLTCPTCHKTSKKFDPIMYLSLPLPESKVKACRILLIALDGSRPPTRYCVDVPSISSIRDLLNSLASLADIQVAPVSSASAPGSVVSLEALGSPGQALNSPSLPRADEIICLTKYKDSSWCPSLTLLPLKSRVSEHMPSTSNNCFDKESFVAYLYPSASQGPKQDNLTPLIVYQSVKTNSYSETFSSIPLLIFAPKMYLSAEEAVKTVSGSYKDISYEIREESMIFQMIKNAFAPVLRDLEPLPSRPLAAPAEVEVEMEEAPPTPSHPQSCAETNGNVKAEAEETSSEKMSVSAFQPSPPIHEPFDMFREQGGDKGDALLSEPCPFKLFASRKDGPKKTFYSSRYNDDDDDEYLTSCLLILEWQKMREAPFACEEHVSHKEDVERGREGRRPVDLHSCFEAFLQPEQLGEDDSWFCPTCKEHVQADKKLDLWALPEVLVIHLKRFYFTRSSRDKLTTKVNFPLRGLDLSSYLQRPEIGIPPVYDCYAVSNHFGGMGGGHYTAYAKSPDSDEWHLFDDSHVSRASAEEVISPAAYVLFYRRRHEASSDLQPTARPGVSSAEAEALVDEDMGHQGEGLPGPRDAGGWTGDMKGGGSGRLEDREEDFIIKEKDYEDLSDLDEPEDGEDENNMMATSP